MSAPRLVQLLGIVIVTTVMITSYFHSSMLLQFGGLGLGVLVFLIGRRLQGSAPA